VTPHEQGRPVENQPGPGLPALPEAASSGAAEPARYRWYHKAGAVLFTIVCFELGVFLLVFPWMDSWSLNYFASFQPAWRDVWLNPYFRGAISGLGLVNIFISFVEIVRLRRFSQPQA